MRRKNKIYPQFCTHGHDTFICGRLAKNAYCIECARVTNRKTRKALRKGLRIRVSKKQFCVNGHDTFKVGRDAGGRCNTCSKIGLEKWRSKSKDKIAGYNRKRGLKKLFNLTIEDYDRMFKNQNGKCKICKRHQDEFKQRLSVDHNHLTGKVRGLLCSKCNIALGTIENTKFYLKLLQYLEEYK